MRESMLIAHVNPTYPTPYAEAALPKDPEKDTVLMVIIIKTVFRTLPV